MRKLENNFRAMLADDQTIGEGSKWEDLRAKFENQPAFEAIQQEYERVRVFNVCEFRTF